MSAIATPATREQFIAERRKGLGGSDVAAILRLDNRKTALQVYLEKVGLPAGEPTGAALRRGNFMEAALLRRYAAECRPEKMDGATPLQDGWRRGNLDGRAHFADGTVHTVEAKSVNRRIFRDEWGEPWSDQVPDRALVQGLWYANLDQVSTVVDFAVCVMPDDPDEVLGLTADEVMAVSEFHVFQCERRPTLETNLIDVARSFWHDHVLPKIPPECQPGTEDVGLRWPETVKDKGRPLTPEQIELVSRYKSIGEQDSERKKLREHLRDQILIIAQDAEYLLGPDGSPWLSMKHEKRAAYSVAASTSRPVRFTRWFNKAHKANS